MDYLDRFLAYLMSEGMSKNTVTGYKSDIKQVFKFIQKPTKKVKKTDAQDFFIGMAERGLSEATRGRYLASITKYYEFCIKAKQVKKNPFEDIKAPKKPKRLPKFLTEQELAALATAAKNEQQRAIIAVLYSTGARVSELCAFNRSDFNFEEHTANIIKGKGNKQRFTFLTDEAIEALKAYWATRKDSRPEAFLNEQNNRIQSGNVQEAIRKMGKQAGIIQRCHPHLLRKTLASHMAQRGADILVISQVLGHEDVSTTQIYAALTHKKRYSVFDELINKQAS